MHEVVVRRSEAFDRLGVFVRVFSARLFASFAFPRKHFFHESDLLIPRK